MKTDISALKGKVEGGTLSADEWNTEVEATEELQEAVDDLVDGRVKSVSLSGGTAQTPDANGNINLDVEKVTVDTELNEESTNAISNSAVATAITDIRNQLSMGEGITYRAYLLYNKSSDNNYVTIDGTFNVGVRFSSVRSEDGVAENANINGTLKIEVSTDGGNNYTTKGTVSLDSREYKTDDLSDSDYDTIDLSSYLSSGTQIIRLSASYTANSTTISSATRIVRITYTSLSVTYADDATQAWAVDSSNRLALNFLLTGEISRTMHVQIVGSLGTWEMTYDVGDDECTNILTTWTKYITLTSATDTYGLLTHGVKTITAWLTCDDGAGNDLSSDKCIIQRMVVADESDTSYYLLLQNLITNATNYVQTKICDYVVYGPSGESVSVTFRLTDYNDTEDYFKMENVVTTNTQYTITNTIEIENDTDDTLYPYLRVEDADGNDMTTPTQIVVDNTEKFAPTSGAVFTLNPKTRSNNETNPETIINGADESEIESTWEGFGGGTTDRWVEDDDGQRVLRILAGEKLTMKYDWLSAFNGNATANVTMEIDFKVSNVTEEETPIIYASEDYGTKYIGFQMKPMEGTILTKNNVATENQNFLLKEGERIHMAINIVSALQSSTDTSIGTLALCRVFLNGVICREFVFSTTTSDWYDSGSDMIIGHEHADIDIYGIRCYNKALSTSQVMDDYISTLPTSAEKLEFREANAILNSGTSLVDIDKCKSAGKNVLIWHGTDVASDTGDTTGYWEIHQYDSNGDELLEYSGTICQETASLTMTGQGTTAKTYAAWNGQTKLKDVKSTISVALSDIHGDMTVSASYTDDNGDTWVDIYGCGLGKRDWANNETIRSGGAQAYAYDSTTDTVTVPDGWIDGNGKYRGKCYLIGEDMGYGIKLVNKINYASCMQSHLMGSNNAYNDLHQAIVGNVGMQLDNSEARIAKAQKPFMYFTQASDNATPAFQGMSTFGPGKMDDAQFRFDKKETPGFVMIEGSDNNLVLTDYRTPWEKQYITYDLDDGEVVGYCYNGTTSVDLDKFADTTVTVDDVDYEGPTADVEQAIEDFFNFMYLHSPRLKVYIGTWDEFLNSDSASETTYKWWCTSGDDAFKLRRYCEPTGEWVEAGWDAENQENVEIDLSTTYATAYSNNTGAYANMNTAFISAIVEDARSGIGDIINVASFKFYYNFVVQFLAGTDNCSKNTYLCRVPKYANSGDYTDNGVYTGAYEWIMGQDDMDTIFATDNSGYQNKPYYVDRNYPTSDVSGSNVYQGNYNVLCDLLEALYGDSGNGDNVTMMRSIFSNMSSLASSSNVWAFMEDYFFSTQKYFPAIAYNEQARIRYEYWQAQNFTSSRGVSPIAQSLGNQLLAEEQFMKRRLILFGSYAGYGGFARSRGSLGISDATSTDVLGIQSEQGAAAHTITFKGLVPHQYMYIGGYIGTTDKYMGTRCAPGESYDFELGETSGDTACALFGANYFRSFGDLGEMQQNSTNPFVINASRLMDVTITESEGFAPPSITLNTPLVETISLYGSSLIGGSLDLSALVRLKSVDLRGTGIVSDVTLPSTPNLTEVHLEGITNLNLVDLPNLTTFSLEDYSNIRTVTISGCPSVNTYIVATALYTQQPENLRSVTMNDITWTDVAADVLMFLADLGASLTGSITMIDAASDRYITLTEKAELVDLYGNIDDEDEDELFIEYTKQNVTSVAITGETTCATIGETYTYALSADGNDVLIKDGKLDVAWTIADTASLYATWDGDFDGTLTVTALDSSESLKHKIGVTVNTISGSTLTATKQVRFYVNSHIPAVGDFAYGDGTFDSEWDADKDYVGMAIMVEDTTTDEGAEAKLVHIVAPSDITVTDDEETTLTTFGWGLYDSDDSTMRSEIVSQCGLSSATDVANLSNLTSTGLTTSSGSSNNYVTADTYVDETAEDGYKSVSSTGAAASYNGKSNTAKIITHANRIIDNYLQKDQPTTLTELANLMTEVTSEYGTRRLCYPAAYACYLYEPTVSKGTLHAQYKSTNWHLMAAGEACRIRNFYRLGTAASAANEDAELEATTPIFANATAKKGSLAIDTFGSNYYWTSNEYSSTNAWCMRFSDGYLYNSSYYKVSGYYVRPCCAFTFVL